MSAIIIDGYNLIGVLHGDMEAERRRLVEALMAYRKVKGHDITVVFDGWRGGEGPEQGSVTGGINVIYSALGETADAFIKRTLAQGDRQWIVISSDRDIQRHAWSHGSVPVNAEDFLRKLDTAAANHDLEIDDYQDDTSRRKGNPKRISKRARALRRALAKL